MATDGHIYIRNKLFLSWLDAEGGRVLSRTLESRLTHKLSLDRQKTRNSLFVTCTFDRKKYGDPFDPSLPMRLWDEACEGDGHLKPFIRKLQRLEGRSFKGKWIAKREFQEGGYLHYHILFYDVNRIEHSNLMQAWSKGGVNFRPVDAGTASYLAKYQGKQGHVPGWLYDKTGRSVKFVTTSPGFWSDVDAARETSRNDADKPKRVVIRPQIRRFDPTGIPEWLLQERARRTVMFRVGRKGNYKTYKFQGDATRCAIALAQNGCEYIGLEYGSYCFEGNIQDARYAVYQSNREGSYPMLPGIECEGAYSSENNQKDTNKNFQAGGGTAAAGLLDTTHKNGDTDTRPDHDQPTKDLHDYGVETMYVSQVDAYGADVMASIDPGYMESGAVIEQLEEYCAC